MNEKNGGENCNTFYKQLGNTLLISSYFMAQKHHLCTNLMNIFVERWEKCVTNLPLFFIQVKRKYIVKVTSVLKYYTSGIEAIKVCFSTLLNLYSQ